MIRIKEKIGRYKRSIVSVLEFLFVAIALIMMVLYNNLYNPTQLEYQILRIFCAVFLYFFIIKLRLHFLIRTDFNERGIDVLELYNEYKKSEYNLSVTERNQIIKTIILQENSKHQKVIRREFAERLAIALIIISMFVLGVV